jgi:DNA-binding transcriptional regulator YiaG
MLSTESEGLLTPRQLAAFLNISVATLYDWRQRTQFTSSGWFAQAISY